MFPGLNDKNTLPIDGCAGALIGRVWLPGANAGPVVVALRDDDVYQIGRASCRERV